MLILAKFAFVFIFGLHGTERGALAGAGQQAPDFTVNTSLKSGEIHFSVFPPAKHHINVKAPMDAEDLISHRHFKPLSVTEKSVLFSIKAVSSRNFALRLFLCDDAKTFCERHEVVVKWVGADSSANEPKPTEQSFEKKLAAPLKTATLRR